MRLIFTDDRGYEAAEAVCADTKEATKLDLDHACVLVFKGNGDTFPMSLVHKLDAALGDALGPNGPMRRCVVIILDGKATLEAVTETQMNAMGWIRKTPLEVHDGH